MHNNQKSAQTIVAGNAKPLVIEARVPLIIERRGPRRRVSRAAPAGRRPRSARRERQGRTAVDTLLRYHHEQSLSKRLLTSEGIFVPALLDT
jgi:hypothetical protein